MLAVKGNQKALLEDIQLLLDDPDAAPDDAAQTVDGDHRRIGGRGSSTFRIWIWSKANMAQSSMAIADLDAGLVGQANWPTDQDRDGQPAAAPRAIAAQLARISRSRSTTSSQIDGSFLMFTWVMRPSR